MTTSPDRITPAALAALMTSAAPYAVLDVRERGAYERGHVFRATALPRRLLEVRLPALVTAPATPLVLIDADGGALAARARTTALALGYRDVRVLEGGLAAWRAEGRRTVQGINVPSKVFGERALHQHKTPQIPPAELAARIARGDDMVIVDSAHARGVRARLRAGRRSACRAASWCSGSCELVKRADQPIVVHCGGRTRSYIGAESLRRMGLPNPIVALENGTMGWELAGLTLERGASRWPPEVTPRSRAAAALVAKRVATEDGIRFVSPDELRSVLARRSERNAYLLDVRTREEYAAGHIAGAVWVPGGQAVQATDECIAVRAESTIVLACDSFARATLTAAWLKRMGFPDVGVLARRAAGVDGGRRRDRDRPPRSRCRPASMPLAPTTDRRFRPATSATPWSSTWTRATPTRAATCRAPRGSAAAGWRIASPPRAGPRRGRRGHVRRRRGFDAGRRHAARARLPGARAGRRHARLGGRRAAARAGRHAAGRRAGRSRPQALRAWARGHGSLSRMGGSARRRGRESACALIPDARRRP